MVNYQPIDATFNALADPARRQIVERLMRGEATISELSAPLPMSMPAVMKHVGRLVDAGLVVRRKEGRTVTCSLRIEPLGEAERWLRWHLDFWNTRLDQLERYLERHKEAEK